jgi:drug/metabolite transporter (DMT)-like permease
MRGLSLLVTAAVLGSALLHAVWNAMAKSVKDHLVGFAALELAAGALCLALLPVVPSPARAAWPYLAVSAVLHVAYATFLLQSYRVGDLNQVYPIARGTAPMVVAVLAVPFAHEHLGALQLAGVLAVGIGLVSLANVREWMTTGRPPTLLFAFTTGLLIAAYSVVDGLGVRRAGNAMGYAVWLILAEAVPIPLYTVLVHRDRLRRAWSTTWLRAGTGGILSFSAYAIVLWAQTRGSLAAVAALRETGVIAAAAIGTLFFGEKFGRRRIVAAALVAAGVALIKGT